MTITRVAFVCFLLDELVVLLAMNISSQNEQQLLKKRVFCASEIMQ